MCSLRIRVAHALQINEHNSDRITLALTTLGDFDFSGKSLSLHLFKILNLTGIIRSCFERICAKLRFAIPGER